MRPSRPPIAASTLSTTSCGPGSKTPSPTSRRGPFGFCMLYLVAPLVPLCVLQSDGVNSVFACVLKLRKADAMVSVLIIRHVSQLGNACIPDPSVIMRPDLSVFSAANGVLLNGLSSGVAALCTWTLLVLLDPATLKRAPHAALA